MKTGLEKWKSCGRAVLRVVSNDCTTLLSVLFTDNLQVIY